ncbi:MAG TPA: carcinine hydrolase/isopenicillin-N N-acyltransferase family protein [Parachlamydiaceae bacterium]|nr:carcinine hydrolase/isopenicillin-N N-acyltransferase family protein [Parachlamydiaceae bacterium]
MNIDYSIPVRDSNSWETLKTPFIYAKRHFHLLGMGLLFNRTLPAPIMHYPELLKHVVLGSLNCIPLVNYGVAYLEKSLNQRVLKVIRLQSTTPYEMGVEQGQLLKEEINRAVYKFLPIFKFSMQCQGMSPLEEAQKLEMHIPEDYRQEMRGMADGAGIPYNELLIVNTTMDVMRLFGCSLYAFSNHTNENTNTKVCATNYFASLGQGRNVADVDQSFLRYNNLQSHAESSDIDSLKEALLKVNYYDTVQSIVFDVNARDIHLATASEYAANTSYTHLKGESLFSSSIAPTTENVVRLARTLDWPLPVLGPETFVLVRPSSDGKKATAVVGWPGFLGALSGINDQGTAISISVVPSVTQKGIPNQFLFRQILEECSTIADAQTCVQQASPASPMNLVVAAADGVAKFELDPARATSGAAHIVSTIQ